VERTKVVAGESLMLCTKKHRRRWHEIRAVMRNRGAALRDSEGADDVWHQPTLVCSVFLLSVNPLWLFSWFARGRPVDVRPRVPGLRAPASPAALGLGRGRSTCEN